MVAISRNCVLDDGAIVRQGGDLFGTELATLPDVAVEIWADDKVAKLVAEPFQSKRLVDKAVIDAFAGAFVKLNREAKESTSSKQP